jgi:DNA mismatch repair protein MutS
MQIDSTTLNDLSIVNLDTSSSILLHVNFTETFQGKQALQQLLQQPLVSIAAINDTQQTIKYLQLHTQKFTTLITNGTIMVIEKYYETIFANYPSNTNKASVFVYKLCNKADFSLTKYTIKQFIIFVKGITEIANLLANANSKLLINLLENINKIISIYEVKQMIDNNDINNISDLKILEFANFCKHNFRQNVQQLIIIYGKLEAYLSLAKTATKYNYCFPNFIETTTPTIIANNLKHPLLSLAKGYDIEFAKEQNFLFLTGANMAGKSTFIKALGLAVYMAHLGMAISANNMQLCFFDGMISNINIADNILKNESYFYNEVQRIKATIKKINDQKKWLILIDELFKGTNIKDAMLCSSTVIEGLQKKKNAVYILSTHLYEIGDQFLPYKNIQFKYFETQVVDNKLHFNYTLKNGISTDRLGYLILEQEGVVNLLK